MYRLGNYQQALCRVVSPNGRREDEVHLVREVDKRGARLVLRAGRDGPELGDVRLSDHGRLTVLGDPIAARLAAWWQERGGHRGEPISGGDLVEFVGELLR